MELVARRKDVASGEWRRLEMLKQFLTVGQVVVELIDGVTHAARDAVLDETTDKRERLNSLEEAVQRALKGPKVVEAVAQ